MSFLLGNTYDSAEERESLNEDLVSAREAAMEVEFASRFGVISLHDLAARIGFGDEFDLLFEKTKFHFLKTREVVGLVAFLGHDTEGTMPNRTKSTIALYTCLEFVPGASDSTSGLLFRIYVEPFARHFGISIDEVYERLDTMFGHARTIVQPSFRNSSKSAARFASRLKRKLTKQSYDDSADMWTESEGFFKDLTTVEIFLQWLEYLGNRSKKQ